MDNLLRSLLPVLLVCGFGLLMYFLYIGGYLTLNNKSAAVFWGKLLGNRRCYKINCQRCKGKVTKIHRPKESRQYVFTLFTDLKYGSAAVSLYTKDKQTLFTLTPESPTATVYLEKGVGYKLQFRLHYASGNISLTHD